MFISITFTHDCAFLSSIYILVLSKVTCIQMKTSLMLLNSLCVSCYCVFVCLVIVFAFLTQAQL